MLAFQIDFWKEAVHVGDHSDIMVSDKHRSIVESIFTTHNISYEITVKDVQKLIMRNEGHQHERRLHDDPILDSERELKLVTCYLSDR